MTKERELEAWVAEKLFGIETILSDRYIIPMHGYGSDPSKVYKQPKKWFEKESEKQVKNYLTDANEWESVVDRLAELGVYVTEWTTNSPVEHGVELWMDATPLDGWHGSKTRQEVRYTALTEAKEYIEELLDNDTT